MSKLKTKVCNPTWEGACRIYTANMEHSSGASTSCRNLAKAELIRCGVILDHVLEENIQLHHAVESLQATVLELKNNPVRFPNEGNIQKD